MFASDAIAAFQEKRFETPFLVMLSPNGPTKTNILVAPENWLEDDSLPFEKVPFQGIC